MHSQQNYCHIEYLPGSLYPLTRERSAMKPITSILSPERSGNILSASILDVAALAVVYFTPLIGHLLQLPFYMIEPMRLMAVISMVHSTRMNSFLLALVLPLFSWVATGHPELTKMLVMTMELGMNVFLFYLLRKKMNSVFLAMIIAITASKILCYSLYLVFFSMMFIREEAEMTFLVAQVITTLLFSLYASTLFRKNSQ
jgi:hypothetical protein